jgi:hypothetical protein
MTPLVRAALTLRRALRGAAVLTATLGLAGVVVLDAVSPWPTMYAALVGAVLAVVLARGLSRLLGGKDRGIVAELELGAVAMVATYWLVLRADRSLSGDTYPAVFVCLAVVSAFARPAAALASLALGVALEVAVRTVAFGEPGPLDVLPHAAFMIIFTGLNSAVLRTEVTRLRSASATRLDEEIERVRTEARSFRLLGAPDTKEAPRTKRIACWSRASRRSTNRCSSRSAWSTRRSACTRRCSSGRTTPVRTCG